MPATLTVDQADAILRAGVLRWWRCGLVKTFDAFTPDARARIGVRGFCKACRNLEVKRRYHLNPEAVLERNARNFKGRTPELDAYKKAWYEANKDRTFASMREACRRRRAKLAGNDARLVTTRDMKRLADRQRHRCFYCDAKTKLEVEHVVPVTRGGRHSIGNLVLACFDCNRGKSTKFVIEFRHRPSVRTRRLRSEDGAQPCEGSGACAPSRILEAV